MGKKNLRFFFFLFFFKESSYFFQTQTGFIVFSFPYFFKILQQTKKPFNFLNFPRLWKLSAPCTVHNFIKQTSLYFLLKTGILIKSCAAGTRRLSHNINWPPRMKKEKKKEGKKNTHIKYIHPLPKPGTPNPTAIPSPGPNTCHSDSAYHWYL